MPIYEYECTNCGERFEAHRKISDSDGEAKCPRCGKKQPRRIFSTFPRLPELLRMEPTQAVSAEACPAKAVCLIERYFFPLDLEVTKQASVQRQTIWTNVSINTLSSPVLSS
jgi:putative FmdB family regulatory protein